MDITDRLNAWIAQVPDDSIIELPRNGCYRLDGTLVLDDRFDLRIRGRGTTFQAFTLGDQGRRHVRVRDGGDIRISNVIIRGANPDAGLADDASNRNYAFQHAFAFGGVQGAVLNRVQAYDVYGDFVYIGSNYRRVPSRDIQILNSTFDRNGRQGIAVVSAQHVLISNCTIANVRMAIIDIEPNIREWSVDDLRVQNSTLGPRRISTLSASSYGQVSNVTFADNTVVGTMRAIVNAKAKDIEYTGFTFTGNTATENARNSGAIMGFTSAQDIYLADNTFPFRDGGTTDLLGLASASHILVEKNTLTGVDDIFVLRNDDVTDYAERDNTT